MSLRRLGAVTLLPAALLTPLVAARGGPETDRGARVFRRVQAAVHAPQTPHFNSRDVQLTTLARVTAPEAARPITVPILPPGCGLGVFGGLDVERTVALAVDLFAIHGYELQPDLLAAGLRLDGLDPGAKVGLLIQPAALGDARTPVKEGTPNELKALERAGYRVLVLPAARYRCMQADTSSPLHACALTMAEFLADLAGERPSDVSVLAQGRSTDIDGAGLGGGVAGATSFQLTDGNAFFVLEQEASVELVFRPPANVKSGDGPTLLTLPFYWTPPLKGSGYDFDAPAPSFTLLQDGMPPLTSGRAVFLADATFDASKPFGIRIALRPGQTHMSRGVRVRTSTGRWR